MKLRKPAKITRLSKTADFPKAIEDQTTKLKASAKHPRTQQDPNRFRTKADERAIIDEVEQIRLHAISVIQNFLGWCKKFKFRYICPETLKNFCIIYSSAS